MTHPGLADMNWTPQSAAQAVLNRLFASALSRCPEASDLAERLLKETGVRLIDLLDHLLLANEGAILALEQRGWTRVGDGPWRNPEGSFPAVLAGTGDDTFWIRVESIDAFLRANALKVAATGAD